jgi:hypothetical protein
MTTIEPSELGKCRKDFSVKLCKEQPNSYKCVKFRKGNKLYLTWEEIYGNGIARDLMQKFNRRNTIIWRHHCLAIPFIIPIDNFSPMSQYDIKYQEKTIVINLKQLAWGAYQYGKLINWGLANGGIGRCKETGLVQCKTPVGIYGRFLKKMEL